jgi:Carbohydrate-selective porin, OprB family/S-layer homology domain
VRLFIDESDEEIRVIQLRFSIMNVLGMLCLLLGAGYSLPKSAAAEVKDSAPSLTRTTSDSTQTSDVVSGLSTASPVTAVQDLEGVSSEHTRPDKHSSKAMAQVTSVSSLSDVQPTDWVFQALQSLVERYGCIAGYPNQTYRGNRALSRYEFAAGLNACMSRIEELIQAAVEPMATKEDLEILKKLQEEFAAELTTIRGRVDTLEAHTAQLEAQQFSTTTKLSGEVIFSVSGASGGQPGADKPQIVFNNRVRLNLTTSFTGKDTLITGLQAYNFPSTQGGSGSSTGQILFPTQNSILGESSVKLNYEPQFPGFNPQDLNARCGNNSVCLYKLLYLFPVHKKLTLFVAPAAEVSDALPTIVPFADEGQGALSRFAALNPVLRVSAGTSGSGQASAAGFIFTPSSKIDFRALYGSVNAALSQNEGFPGTPLGAGLFNGSYVISSQLTLKPTKALNIGLNYANSYHQVNIAGTGLSSADTEVLSGLSLDTGVTMHSFGATLAWRISPRITFTTYGSYILVDEAGGDAFTNLTSWMTGLYFPDALVKGSSAGLVFGQPLYRVDAGDGAALTPVNVVDRATPFHLEAFYNLKINDFISVTPGAMILFNPEGDSNNKTTGVGVVRTTFKF